MEWLSKLYNEKFFKIVIKQKLKYFKNSCLDVSKTQIYFGFQYINESSVKFVQNGSNVISKYFNFIKCVPYFKKKRNLSYFCHQLMNLTEILLLESIELFVMTVLSDIFCETKRALTLTLR